VLKVQQALLIQVAVAVAAVVVKMVAQAVQA
jgi:hypothetical protein